MPALKPTEFTARIIWLGRVPQMAENIRSEPLDEALLSFDGIAGETHSGALRPSCSRVLEQHPRGTPIRNVRQLSVLSAEEMAQTAEAMGLTRLEPEWLGASMVVEGLADFTHIPPSSRLQAPSGACLVVDMENRPCNLPAREIAGPHPEAAAQYKQAARGRRGVTAWVEREGMIRLGDELRLHIPDQPVWPHLAAARGV